MISVRLVKVDTKIIQALDSGSRRTTEMSALVILPPDMEQEDVVELLIHRNNMESSAIIVCEFFQKKTT